MNFAIRSLIGASQPLPAQHRRNFILLYLDVVFWGMLNGSILVFLAVYISRLGASPLQVGLFSASPALINLLFTFPANSFSRGKSTYKIARWAHLINRLFYALLIPLPVLLPAATQIWVVVVITLLMSIPGTAANFIGNAFFAETVPDEWRGQVVGIRNALVAATTMLTSFVVGQVLTRLPFTTAYQVVFIIGFSGSILSVIMLFLIHPVVKAPEPTPLPAASPEIHNPFHFEILVGPFGLVILTMFIFYFALNLPGPIFPIYQVRALKLTDETISLATSLFWVVYFLTCTQSSRISRKLGFQRMTGIGTIIIGGAALIFAFSYHTWIFMVCQLVNGFGWGMINSGFLNYLLQHIPSNNRTPYLAWFNLSMNSAVLVCGLVAPLLSNSIGMMNGLLLAVAARILAGLVVLKWG